MNGLNALYLSIIGCLSVVELGVGSAIAFSMYKPIVEGDKPRVAALYQLFTKSYWVIGGIIFIIGLALIPTLPYLAKDYASIDVNLYLTFFLVLVSVVITYLYNAKTALINAYKNDYVTTTITSCASILQCVLQILTLVWTRSFIWYLICRIIAGIVQWLAVEIFVRLKHRDILQIKKQSLDVETKADIKRNIKAMFMHKVGTALVNSADSIIISAFIGIALLGKYSNYAAIITAMMSVITLFFTPLTSIIGHMFVAEKELAQRYYEFFYALNFVIGIVFFGGYYAIIDNLVAILFGIGLELPKSVSFVITVNYFVQFMRQSTLLFRDATGTFYNDRWKPLFEGITNVILSVAFVILFTKFFGEAIGIVGVIAATIVTNLIICHIVEPYVLYKYAFCATSKKHLIMNYLYIAAFTIELVVLGLLMRSFGNQWLELFVNGCISMGLAVLLCGVTFASNKEFRYFLSVFLNKKIRHIFAKKDKENL